VFEEFQQYSLAEKLLEKGLKNLTYHKNIYVPFQSNDEDCTRDIFLKCEDYFSGLIMKFKLFQGDVTVTEFISGVKTLLHHDEMKTHALLEGLSEHGSNM
jgi:hypothetical protein